MRFKLRRCLPPAGNTQAPPTSGERVSLGRMVPCPATFVLVLFVKATSNDYRTLRLPVCFKKNGCEQPSASSACTPQVNQIWPHRDTFLLQLQLNSKHSCKVCILPGAFHSHHMHAHARRPDPILLLYIYPALGQSTHPMHQSYAPYSSYLTASDLNG